MGIYQSAMERLVDCSLAGGGYLKPKDLADYNLALRKHKFDSHTIFQGNNGMGKTMASFIVKSFMGELDIARDVIYPQTPVDEVISRITKEKNVNFMFDELSHLFPYKRSMESSQIALFSAIEVARANKNAFLGCCRDLSTINNNYRNGKAQVLVWMLDREDDCSLASVHLASPVSEIEDKFFIDHVQATYNYNHLIRQVMRLPSFIGFMEFDDVTKYVPQKTIDEYEAYKKAGIEFIGEKHRKILARKRGKEDGKNELETGALGDGVLSLRGHERVSAGRQHSDEEHGQPDGERGVHAQGLGLLCDEERDAVPEDGRRVLPDKRGVNRKMPNSPRSVQ